MSYLIETQYIDHITVGLGSAIGILSNLRLLLRLGTYE